MIARNNYVEFRHKVSKDISVLNLDKVESIDTRDGALWFEMPMCTRKFCPSQWDMLMVDYTTRFTSAAYQLWDKLIKANQE